MEKDTAAYQEAIDKITYVEKVKQEICMLLDWLTDVRSSHMYVSVLDFNRACAIMKESIDELFYEEMRYARDICDSQK